MNESNKTRIAHLAGPTATIQNTPPLVTSNKARAKRGLPLLKDVDGVPLRHDALRPQSLAAPVKVYVEQFSAHPLESPMYPNSMGLATAMSARTVYSGSNVRTQ